MTILDDARAGMDLNIRPQDDLFGYMNGNWLATEEIPEDRSSWGPFVQLADAAESRVRAIIEQCADDVAAGTASDNARKIGALFASFMDEQRVEALGTTPIQAELDAVRGLSSLEDLPELVGRMERRGCPGLFGSYIDSDDRQSDRYLLNLTQGGLGLPDESYYREEKFAEIREAYVAYLAAMFGHAGEADPERAAQQVYAVEERLAQGHLERAETRDVLKSYNLHDRDAVQQRLARFALEPYAAGLGTTVASFAEVNVRQPSYLDHVNEVLAEFDLEHWRSYLAIRVIRSAAAYLSSPFVETNFDFFGRTLAGTPQLRARWKRGVAFVEGAVGEAVGELYVARHFPPSSKALMDDLVANLLQAYRVAIEALDWMGEETKQRAYRKLDTFMPKIGYPTKFRDYSTMAVDPADLLGNVRAVSAFETDRQFAKLGSPVDRDEWFMLPQTVNAYYNPGTNEICFPAGILQRPFFDPEADPAENYGGIGAVIGHEIGHGFDDQGSQFDEHGNLQEWWTEADRAAFKQRSDKLVEQFDQYSPRNLPGQQVNGSLTVGENIGDIGGVTIGLAAYRISLDGEPSPVVAGKTGEQRFFENWAYVWRTKRRRELEQQYLTVDPHSPPEFRANVVRNLDEFHQAFATSPGDGLWLDPDQRVRIW